MLSRRDILKVSAVSAAAAGMIGGIVKNAAADDHRNIVPPSSYQPPADAQHLYKYKFTDSKKRSLPSGWAREATVEQFPISEGVAGVDMTLEPGGVRELH